MEENGWHHALAILPLPPPFREESPLLIAYEAGGGGLRDGLDSVEKKWSCTAGNRTSAVEPIARRYANWSVPKNLPNQKMFQIKIVGVFSDM
jgi:hypothetical protein